MSLLARHSAAPWCWPGRAAQHPLFSGLSCMAVVVSHCPQVCRVHLLCFGAVYTLGTCLQCASCCVQAACPVPRCWQGHTTSTMQCPNPGRLRNAVQPAAHSAPCAMPAGKDMQFATELPGPRDTGESFVPTGAFGQRYPQNVHTLADSPAVKPAKLKPKGPHKDADRVDSDGLPHVGAVVWPGQSYYSTKDVSDGVNGERCCLPAKLFACQQQHGAEGTLLQTLCTLK